MKFILTFIFSLGVCVSAFAFEGTKPLAKDFSLPSMDGKTISLSEQRGKVVVLTFWSTSCPICHSELPKLNQVVNRNSGREVIFLSLTMENESKVLSFLNKKPLNSIVLPNSLGVLMDYANKDRGGNFNMEYPSYFVINQTGEIELTASGRGKTDQLDTQINRLLSK